MKNNWIRELFTFSKKERSGIVSLLLIIFIVIPQARNLANADREIVIVKSENNHKRDTVFRSTFAENKRARVNRLDLNSADSLHLLEIPGIGPVFASRIIRYRTLLGGYYAVDQLREVYGMRAVS